MRTKKERRKLHIQKKNPNMLVPKKEKIKWQNKKNRKRKKKKRGSQHTLATERKNQRKKKTVVYLEVNSKGIFGSSFHELSSLSFLSILERKFFGGPREKTLEPQHLFSFLPTQLNTLQKVFLPIFSSKFSIHPISPPNKHTVTLSIPWPSLFFIKFYK